MKKDCCLFFYSEYQDEVHHCGITSGGFGFPLHSGNSRLDAENDEGPLLGLVRGLREEQGRGIERKEAHEEVQHLHLHTRDVLVVSREVFPPHQEPWSLQVCQSAGLHPKEHGVFRE